MKSGIGTTHFGSRLFGPEMLDDPYPIYRELRENDPVHWEESLQTWVLTRYSDVSSVLNDKRFSSNRVSQARERFPDPELAPLFDTLAHLMLQRDEPDHARLRGLIQAAFLRTSIEQWEPSIQSRVQALLDTGLAKGSMDFMQEFAVPLPLLVISEIVGIPAQDRHRVKAWCDDFSRVALNFYAHITPEQLRRGLDSVLAFREYLRGKVDPLRVSPSKDLLTSLVQAEHEHSRLTLDELLANALLLMNAGNETTTQLLGNGLAALLQHPDQLQKLRDDRSLIPNAVEEFLRYDSPVQFLGRVASEDVELREKKIHRGQIVLVIMGSANRDPEQFPDPDRLDVTRTGNNHLAFGHGRHFCAGSNLARLEARLAFGTILDRLKTIELETTDLKRQDNFNLRGFRHLPIRIAS